MVGYVDTSLLVSMYAYEDAATQARELLVNLDHPVPLNSLLWLELRNALRRKVCTGRATAEQVTAMLDGVDKSVAEGFLDFREIDFLAAFDRAEELSARFTERTNARASDLLHVAIAVETGCSEFLTFDKDQAKLARSAGLTVKPMHSSAAL